MKTLTLLSVSLFSLGLSNFAMAQTAPHSSPLFNREIRCKSQADVLDHYSGIVIPLTVEIFARDGYPISKELWTRISGGGGGETIQSPVTQDALHTFNTNSTQRVESVSLSTDDRRVQLIALRDDGTAWRFTAVINSTRYGVFKAKTECHVF